MLIGGKAGKLDLAFLSFVLSWRTCWDIRLVFLFLMFVLDHLCEIFEVIFSVIFHACLFESFRLRDCRKVHGTPRGGLSSLVLVCLLS